LILEDKHKSFGDLNRYVLKKSVIELNETELSNVKCVQKKIGTKTIGITFIFDLTKSKNPMNLYNEIE
jgi:plasmid replication initiation protein